MIHRRNLRAIPTAERHGTVDPGERASACGSASAASIEPPVGALIGECLRTDHPTLYGRALVRWQTVDGSSAERWLPSLLTVTVRPADRVLMLMPSNFEEPVVIGVLDGFAQRPAAPVHGGPVLELQHDEVVRVQARDGTPLLELTTTQTGPLVRLLREDVSVELPGALRISARSIALSAQQGEVSITATDDVVLTGSGIRLN